MPVRSSPRVVRSSPKRLGIDDAWGTGASREWKTEAASPKVTSTSTLKAEDKVAKKATNKELKTGMMQMVMSMWFLAGAVTLIGLVAYYAISQ